MESAPKYNFVRTHTARRSYEFGDTNGAAVFFSKLASWKKLEMLKKYLLASRLDVAMVAAE